MTIYKVYEKSQTNTILRMVTRNKQMAEKYRVYANNHFRNVWIKKEKED